MKERGKHVLCEPHLLRGSEPELIDGDVFKTIVPLGLSFIGVNDKMILNDKLNIN